MQPPKVFGIVVNNIFYSNRMESRVNGYVNGIYSIDMSQDDFMSTLQVADISDARKFFSKASMIQLVRGVSFHDGIIPENPIKYPKIPIKVLDATYDDFQEIEVAIIKNKICYFIQVLSTSKSYTLMEISDLFANKKYENIKEVKGITPDIRIACAFHLMEMKKKELEEPIAAIKNMMQECGARVDSVKKTNTGYEVSWSFSEYTIKTLVSKDYKVIEAGYCVSGYDKTQSAKSVVNLLKDYVEDGDRVVITRV